MKYPKQKQILIKNEDMTQEYIDNLYSSYRALMKIRDIQISHNLPEHRIDKTDQQISEVATLINDVEFARPEGVKLIKDYKHR